MSEIELGHEHLTDAWLRERIFLTCWVARFTGRDRHGGYIEVPNGPPISVPKWKIDIDPNDAEKRRRTLIGYELDQPKTAQEIILPENKARFGEHLLFTSLFNVEEWCVDLLGLGSTPTAERTAEHAAAVKELTHRVCFLVLKLREEGLLQLKVQRFDALIELRDADIDWSADPEILCFHFTYRGLRHALDIGEEKGWERAPSRAAGVAVDPINVQSTTPSDAQSAA